jgi:hypothetical protein
VTNVGVGDDGEGPPAVEFVEQGGHYESGE